MIHNYFHLIYVYIFFNLHPEIGLLIFERETERKGERGERDINGLPLV